MKNVGRMNEIHLEVLKKIKKGKQIVTVASPDMFRFSRDRGNMYALHLLSELGELGYITDENELTAEGELLILINS